MSVVLTLLPVEGGEGNWFSQSMVQLARKVGDFADALDAVAVERPDIKLWSYVARDGEGEPRYGIVEDDLYGNPLKYIHADDFLKCLRPYQEELNWHRAKAAIAYVRELTPDTLIGLYYS